MFKFLQSVVGGVAHSVDSEASGVLYIRGTLKKAGYAPDRMPEEFYRELSAHAHKFSQSMSQLSTKEKPVTYFVQHLDYIATLLESALDGSQVEASGPLVEILTKYGLQARDPYA